MVSVREGVQLPCLLVYEIRIDTVPNVRDGVRDCVGSNEAVRLRVMLTVLLMLKLCSDDKVGVVVGPSELSVRLLVDVFFVRET